MPKIRLLVNSCSCPPLFTLDTLLVFLDTFMKHPTCEEFLFCHMKDHCSIHLNILIAWGCHVTVYIGVLANAC